MAIPPAVPTVGSMSESLRAVGLVITTTVSLGIAAMGLAALVETDDPDWELLVIGLVAVVTTVLPLLLGRGPRERVARADPGDPAGPGVPDDLLTTGSRARGTGSSQLGGG